MHNVVQIALLLRINHSSCHMKLKLYVVAFISEDSLYPTCLTVVFASDSEQYSFHLSEFELSSNIKPILARSKIVLS